MSGHVDKAVGATKETVGKATDNPDLEVEGKTQKVAGDIKNAGENVKDTSHEIAEKIKR